jgi:thiosulfate reductase cytochrome b subunit
MATGRRIGKDGRVAIYRHPLLVRVTHWVNALCLILLVLSGLQILNAHPAFYWGEDARFAQPLAAITAVDDGRNGLAGRLTLGGAVFDTTGVLGVSATPDGGTQAVAFPGWMTLPSYHDLGAGRRWHFFFAWALVLNGLLYGLYSLPSGRLTRLMWPTRSELRGIGRSVLDHARLRFSHGGEDSGYNVLQKLAYLSVILGLLPLMLVTGLAMAPGVDARLPLLSEIFGGRQSARTVHFLAASGLVLFALTHIAMVVAAGPVNEMRSILTGWFVLGKPASKD